MDQIRPTYLIAKRTFIGLQNAAIGAEVPKSVEQDVISLIDNIKKILNRVDINAYHQLKFIGTAPEKLKKAFSGEEKYNYENILYCAGLLGDLLDDLESLQMNKLCEPPAQSSVQSESNNPIQAVTMIKKTLGSKPKKERLTPNQQQSPGLGKLREIEEHVSSLLQREEPPQYFEVVIKYGQESHKERVNLLEFRDVADVCKLFHHRFGITKNETRKLWMKHFTSSHEYLLENIADLKMGTLIECKKPDSDLGVTQDNKLYSNTESKLDEILEKLSLVDKQGKIELQLNKVQELSKELKQEKANIIKYRQDTSMMFEYIETLFQEIKSKSQDGQKDDALLSIKSRADGIKVDLAKFSHLLETVRNDLTRGYPKPHGFVSSLIKSTIKKNQAEIESLVKEVQNQKVIRKNKWQQTLNQIMAEQNSLKDYAQSLNTMVEWEKKTAEIASTITPVLELQSQMIRKSGKSPSIENVWSSQEIEEFGAKKVIMELAMIDINTPRDKLEDKISNLKNLKFNPENVFFKELSKRATKTRENRLFDEIERKRDAITFRNIESIFQ